MFFHDFLSALHPHSYLIYCTAGPVDRLSALGKGEENEGRTEGEGGGSQRDSIQLEEGGFNARKDERTFDDNISGSSALIRAFDDSLHGILFYFVYSTFSCVSSRKILVNLFCREDHGGPSLKAGEGGPVQVDSLP